MSRLLFCLSSILILYGCKNASPDLSGNEKINADDCVKAFSEIKLPVSISDTSLKNFGDTIKISKAVFTQFIPDSALNIFTKTIGGGFIIHAAGIIHTNEKDFLI